MKFQKLTVLSLLFFILMIAPLPAALAQNATTKNARRLLQADADFSKLSAAQGVVAAFAAYLTDDAVLLPDGEEPLTGKQAILERLGRYKNYTLTWQPTHAEISGQMGYTYGIGTYETKDAEGKAQFFYSKYVTVWKKQKDGSWKVVLDMGNDTPAPKAKVR